VAGYANRVIHIAFPELSDDPEDPIWLSIRNPQYMAPSEMRPRDLAQGPDGKPADSIAAMEAMYEVYAKMILGWRVYDPDSIRVDPETGDIADMDRMPSPPTADLVAKLPMVILNKLSEVVKNAVNPPWDSERNTTKTLSSLPSPSTTEPGPLVQFPERSAILS
jgi:hypothetical protein